MLTSLVWKPAFDPPSLQETLSLSHALIQTEVSAMKRQWRPIKHQQAWAEETCEDEIYVGSSTAK